MSVDPSSFMSLPDRVARAHQLVQLATLAAVALKLAVFLDMVRVYVDTPLEHDFFPVLFRSTSVLCVTYVLACAGLLIAATTKADRARIAAGWVVLASISILCIHQGSHNDMTFATAWWSSLWSVWLAHRIPKDAPEPLITRAAFLSRCIASMILLGGAVGKWTHDYWSGQVLYEIYFIERDFWLFNLLRSSLDAESLRDVATWYSRKIIVIETLCGFLLWLLPPRLAAGLAILVFTSIALFSNFYLFSVLLSLIGLAACGLFVPESRPNPISVKVDSV